MTPRPGDGTGVLDLDLALGDQKVRTLGNVEPGQKVDVQVLLSQEIARVVGFLVVVTFDPSKLSVVSGRRDGVFAEAVDLPVQIDGNTVKYGASFLGQTKTVKGAVAILTFQALSGFSGDTEILLKTLTIRITGSDNNFAPGASIVLIAAEKGIEAISGDADRDGDVDFEDFFISGNKFWQDRT